jgi:general secretion pathway protein C
LAILNLFGSVSPGQGAMDPAPGPVRATELNLSLRGILADRNSDRKLALIAQADQEEQVYWLGEMVAGAEIARIESGRVLLKRNGAYEALIMDELMEGRDVHNRPPADPAVDKNQPPADNRYVINKGMLVKQMNDLEGLLQQAHAVPHNDKEGHQIGYRMVNLPRGSVFRKLGLRQEDVIKSVNGTSVLNTREALEAYRDLKTASNFSIGLLRDGREINIDYSIQ